MDRHRLYGFERLQNGTLYVGTDNGISEHKNYTDNGSTYRFKYFSPSLTFGDASRMKIVKKLKPTLVGADQATIFLKWGYDFSSDYTTVEYKRLLQKFLFMVYLSLV